MTLRWESNNSRKLWFSKFLEIKSWGLKQTFLECQHRRCIKEKQPAMQQTSTRFFAPILFQLSIVTCVVFIRWIGFSFYWTPSVEISDDISKLPTQRLELIFLPQCDVAKFHEKLQILLRSKTILRNCEPIANWTGDISLSDYHPIAAEWHWFQFQLFFFR